MEMLRSSWPKMFFIEKSLNNDYINWWAPNQSCVEAILRTCGFKVVAKSADEIFICETDSLNTPVASGWNHSEYLSATGKAWKKFLNGKIK